jgi:hypothetical protein
MVRIEKCMEAYGRIGRATMNGVEIEYGCLGEVERELI